MHAARRPSAAGGRPCAHAPDDRAARSPRSQPDGTTAHTVPMPRRRVVPARSSSAVLPALLARPCIVLAIPILLGRPISTRPAHTRRTPTLSSPPSKSKKAVMCSSPSIASTRSLGSSFPFSAQFLSTERSKQISTASLQIVKHQGTSFKTVPCFGCTRLRGECCWPEFADPGTGAIPAAAPSDLRRLILDTQPPSATSTHGSRPPPLARLQLVRRYAPTRSCNHDRAELLSSTSSPSCINPAA
ncbi:hypothetical protein SETIT_3G286000v2 [Setaria italica]|uniref:Uncharacterized protein n=1 Tax=Setaria italica TaxID=4555 RepID=A0A368QJZ2_SETIT|nr:hypothetical protein SETIT_3G286000v2 [Setaria italica]RCV18262.1 hypothetical protein SETIT_3G286000v2 [Setaria italica]